LKAKIACPVCGSEEKKKYHVPGHPELSGERIDIFSLKYEGVTICMLVCCAKCGNVYDAEGAKKIV